MSHDSQTIQFLVKTKQNNFSEWAKWYISKLVPGSDPQILRVSEGSGKTKNKIESTENMAHG